MEYLLIISILALLIVAILLFKLIKNLVKTLLTLLMIIVVVSAVLGVIVFFDARDFINGIKHKDNMFLLNDNGFVSGFTMERMNKSVSISSQDLDMYYMYYVEEDYKKMLGEKNQFFVFELESLEDKKYSGYVDFLKGANTLLELEEDQGILNPMTAAFSALIVSNLRKDPLYLIKSYQNGNLTIYPESITFKIIKIIK
jgi:hypothetical protein